MKKTNAIKKLFIAVVIAAFLGFAFGAVYEVAYQRGINHAIYSAIPVDGSMIDFDGEVHYYN